MPKDIADYKSPPHTEIEPLCHSLAPGESMPGSTEVLESLIGKRRYRLSV